MNPRHGNAGQSVMIQRGSRNCRDGVLSASCRSVCSAHRMPLDETALTSIRRLSMPRVYASSLMPAPGMESTIFPVMRNRARGSILTPRAVSVSAHCAESAAIIRRAALILTSPPWNSMCCGAGSNVWAVSVVRAMAGIAERVAASSASRFFLIDNMCFKL